MNKRDHFHSIRNAVAYARDANRLHRSSEAIGRLADALDELCEVIGQADQLAPTFPLQTAAERRFGRQAEQGKLPPQQPVA